MKDIIKAMKRIVFQLFRIANSLERIADNMDDEDEFRYYDDNMIN